MTRTTRVQAILLVTASAFSIGAFAQTAATPSAAAPEVRIVTPTTDPLVQKRKDNALANKQYKENKTAAKQDYKQRVTAAKVDRKQLKKDATAQEKSAMAGDTPAAPLQALPVAK